MSQHSYVIPDELGAQHLATLNAVMQAIVTMNSGPAEPGTMYPYQFWADTTNGLLKQRNAANNAWVTICSTANWALASVQLQASVAFTTTGTAPAYAVTTVPVLALAANQRLRVKFNQANGGAASTLAKDGGATKAIKVYSPAGVKEDPIINANVPYDLEYDGTDWVILNRTPVSAAGFSNLRVFQRFSGTGAISGTTLTISAAGSGALQIGSIITGSGVSANTKVTGFGTYTPGGTGTLTVNNSQTVSSTALSSTQAELTVPSEKLKVTVVGGGGSSGSSATGGVAQGSASGGGGGGGAAIRVLSGLTIGSLILITIGAAGGTTSFGSHCSASGGSSSGNASSDQATSGGTGGVGTGGDLNIKGQDGAAGILSYLNGNGTSVGGMGGSSLLGGGGGTSVGNSSGRAGGNFGGGAGGSSCFTSSQSASAGGGAPGVCVVEW